MKKPLTLAATVATLALSLSACGSHSNPGSANAGAEPGGQTQQGMGQNAAGGRFPGASGKIAAVSGKTAQVQSTDSQTAVTWTSSTTFTQEKSVSKNAVKVGACVMASPAQGASSGSDTSTVAAATRSGRLRTFETVPTETPAAMATSRTLTMETLLMRQALRASSPPAVRHARG